MDSFHLRILIERSTLDENLLNIAASKGYTEIVRILLPRFDPNVKNAKAQTPLHVAVSNKHRDVIRFLLESGADPNVPDSDRKTPLHTAAKKRLYEIVKDLLRSGGDLNADLTLRDSSNRTPLLIAASLGNAEIFEVLLEQGADLDSQDEEGKTALHLALEAGNLALTKRLIELFKDKSLLDVQDSSGKTSLYQAAYSGMKLVIELLLEAGADVNIRSKAGKLPLHEGTDNHDITLLLAEAKSDLNAEDEDGWTPLMLCVYWEHLDAI
ncbi:hypothetical protein TRIATDRAFT_203737, partial [Trichoderma atroviride IMI 206040]